MLGIKLNNGRFIKIDEIENCFTTYENRIAKLLDTISDLRKQIDEPKLTDVNVQNNIFSYKIIKQHDCFNKTYLSLDSLIMSNNKYCFNTSKLL